MYTVYYTASPIIGIQLTRYLKKWLSRVYEGFTQILVFGPDPTKLTLKIGKHIIGLLLAAGSQAHRPAPRQQGHRHVRALLNYVILSLSLSLSWTRCDIIM